LEFSADRREIERRPNESDAVHRQRTQRHWGLMEWVEYTCKRLKVHRLLIEAKGSGQSAAQELSNRFGILDFVVDPTPVKGDKLSRALAVQANFANGMIYAPNRDWAELVITEMEVFPKGRYDDLTVSTTQAISTFVITACCRLTRRRVTRSCGGDAQAAAAEGALPSVRNDSYRHPPDRSRKRPSMFMAHERHYKGDQARQGPSIR
jgi:predicted phage terminase large subunit-like protein